MRSFWTLSALLLIFPLVGCSQEQTPDKAMKVIATSLTENKPQVAWDGLPPSYQNDVDGLVHDFAGKMDPELWNGGFDIAKKIVKIMDEKRDFILQSEMLSSMGVKAEVAKENWDGLVKALSTLVDSDLSSLEDLKTIKVENFLAGSGADFMEQMSALAAISNQKQFEEELADYKAAKFKLVSSEGDTGTIEITVPNKDVETVEMVKVEGKWIPKELADEWATKMQEARDGLANFPVEEMEKNKEKVLAQMKMIDTQLTLLLDSKTADEFNAKAGAMALMLSMGAANFGGQAAPLPSSPGSGAHGLSPEENPYGGDPLPGGALEDTSGFSPPSDLNAPPVTVPPTTVPGDDK